MQQDEIWAAADALLTEGLRPTIERVRQKLGRGSPNTVSPMLEAWFATLGPRLGALKDGPEDMPAPVRMAAVKLWDVALQSAQQEISSSFEQERNSLDEDRTALHAREYELAHREQVLAERIAASDKALQLARNHADDLTARLEQAHAMLLRRDQDIAQLRFQLAELEKQRDAARRLSDEESRRHVDERNRLSAQSAASERRWLVEIDRERQISKQARTVVEETERRFVAARVQLEAANKILGDQLQETSGELRATRQALASANERSSELRSLLDEQGVVSATTLHKLKTLLADRARKSPASLINRRRLRP